ncbi:hypothetical protein GQX73_g217 [Xylaria multiplex]|uniref:Uncharacterized protein n=1 Tax=Xylaria multiplex TaxID=323545 RepID=A0A7C8IVJ0_9PEZI|nr:hypothetical protein GQX73_g217 [Xylaria multiplex]
MAPPPATPTPHRFLVPKRSQPRNETPKPAFQPSSQQFHATPRFSLHSTPRNAPSSSSTPFRHRGAGRDVVIDSSPPPLPGVDDVVDDDDDAHDSAGIDEGYGRSRVGYEQDLVIDEDDAVQESSPIRSMEEADEEEDRDRNEGRRAKRRRISISPLGVDIEAPSSPPQINDELDVPMHDTVLGIESSFSEPAVLENDVDLDIATIEDDIINNGGTSPDYGEKPLAKAHQPTFQKAPRFKPAEIPEGAPHPEPLPDAFSPRRKGAKYIPGGLAAELRDWLVDVEAGIGSGSTAAGSGVKRDEEWVARIQVDELRGAYGSARGMRLVLGRQVLDGKHSASSDDHRSEEAVEVLGANTFRLILAGPGRLNGLGVGHDVKPGAVLGIARPTWEVVLDGLGRWGVACDWVVLR